ncbi:MAG: efflux RND transporter periplasmic adaptor subunit [Candidatus Hydrogenedentes bacterium]|nr:efflux RND transporter periplasmic adaptor subunit [Candidatus Hydrogenedentota bacterium]
MKNSVAYLNAILILGLMASLCGCNGTTEAVGEGSAVQSQRPVPVKAARATLTTIRPSVDLVGSLATIPEQTAIISTQVAGQIAKLAVVEGQHVRAGDTIAVLDSRMRQLDLDMAKAGVAVARAAYERLKNGPRLQEIDVARSETAKAEAAVKALQVKLKALKPLVGSGQVSKVRYEQVQSDLDAAKAAAKAATAQLELLKVGTRPESLDEAQAHLRQAEADMAAKQLAVDMCTLKTPVDGVVTSLPVRMGMHIDESATVATVIDMSELFARVRVPAHYAPLVHLGDSVDVTVRSVTDKPIVGTLARRAQQADAMTGDVDMSIRVKNADGHLYPGLACTAQIGLPEAPNAVTIPVEAVSDRDGTAVVTVIRDGKAYETEVTVGVRTKKQVQILKGIKVGELVATEGGYGLPEGYPVTASIEE